MSHDHSNKPEGATHVIADIYGLSDAQKVANDRCCYRKKEDGLWYGFERGKWFAINNPEVHRYQKLPEQWTGEGLPPVGTMCWYGSKNEERRIVAHIDQGEEAGELRFLAVLQIGEMGQITLATAEHWKPIRTPEQIAAEEREKACRELLKDCYQDDNAFALVQAGRLYDAGWRKQVTE